MIFTGEMKLLNNNISVVTGNTMITFHTFEKKMNTLMKNKIYLID